MTSFQTAIAEQDRNLAVVRELFSELAKGNMSVLDKLVAEDYVQHSIMGVPQGRDGVRRFFQEFATAFPDLHIEIEDMAADGDRVFLRGTMSGTWQGEYLGQKPNGKKFRVVEFDEFRLGNGIIIEHWDALDTGSLARQLGFSSHRQVD